ncbi:hypothetical protein SNEBB_000381 [Seison nebaliae]|nr:hypothetical protein SNEBB_000381 [Seison nebaliae]
MPIRPLIPKPKWVKGLAKFPPSKYTDERSILKRLPRSVIEEHREKFLKQPQAISYIPDIRDSSIDQETGEFKRFQNVPYPIVYPEEADRGLWGGEGLIACYMRRPHYMAQKFGKIFKPKLIKRLFYSEILDKHYAICVTISTLDQILYSKGFDFYILKTSNLNLASRLGVELKRQMLLRLIEMKENGKKDDVIYKRYSQFNIKWTREDLDWMGLTIDESKMKQRHIENELYRKELEEEMTPRMKYREELFRLLEEQEEEEKNV